MSDLVEWLRLQLDEDERAAGPEARGWETGSRYERQPLAWVQHVRRWPTDRVLREVEAKRRILERHEGTADASLAAGREAYPDLDWSPMCHTCEVTWPCGEILDMAWVYSDRPGYLPEWARR